MRAHARTGSRCPRGCEGGASCEEILDEVREGQYDIVVLGDAHSFSASRLLVRSTVTHVIQNARTCVMVIRPTRMHIAEQNR